LNDSYRKLRLDSPQDAGRYQILQTELDIERADIEAIKHFADPGRHGAPAGITAEDQAETFRTARQIVNKFIHYKKQ
jgi:hypothetical protein